MRGRAALLAEVARGADEPFAEVVLPEAIHHDAGGERIARIDDGLREFETAAADEKGLLRAEEAQKLSRHGFGLRQWIATSEDARCDGLRTVF